MGFAARYFLFRFPRLVSPGDPRTAGQIRARARELLRQVDPPDTATRAIVLYAASVAAAYEILAEAGWSLDAARERLREAFAETAGGRWVPWGTRWLVRFLGTRRTVRFMGGERALKWYGPSFSFSLEMADSRCFVTRVGRCGFHDYLRRFGVPELTPVFCSWDLLWADELNRPGTGVRFSRPQTIAEGADVCVFAFRFTETEGSERAGVGD